MNASGLQPESPESQAAESPGSLSNSVYLDYLADVLLEYLTDGGRKTNLPEVYRDVMSVTDKTIGTVKNWLTYRTHSPDVASLARIVAHWSIPSAAIFPNRLTEILDGQAAELPPSSTSETGAIPLITLYGPNDKQAVNRVLRPYTDHPNAAVFVRKEGSDMREEIGTDQLMLIDSSSERVDASGMYLLRFDEPGSPVVVRHVDRVFGERSPSTEQSAEQGRVALRGGSLSTAPPVITALVNGVIPNVTVLGRVVAVLRQT